VEVRKHMRVKTLFWLFAVLLFTSAAFAEAGGLASDPHYAKAVELRAQAQSAYDSGNYDGAADLARQAKAELALIQGKLGRIAASTPAAPSGEALPLPASYTVRLIPDDRDCLSKIAGYPFVYGDRNKWPLIYRANKTTLKHPENADIILPGEILLIPSIAGETRSGAWEEGKDYPVFVPAK